MNFIQQIITNKYIYVPFLLWFFIQLFKVIWDLFETKKFNFKRIMGAGGMPSSHSAVVTSLTTLIGKNEGFASSIFALSLIFAFIVMYDAAGVRRAAGKQARLLNKIVETPGLTRTSGNRKTSRGVRSYTNASICRSINRNNSRSNTIKNKIKKCRRSMLICYSQLEHINKLISKRCKNCNLYNRTIIKEVYK